MEIIQLPIDQIQPQELIRPVDEQKLDDLVQSVKSIGIIEPLIVARQDQAYKLIAGQRRLIAARRSSLPTVPCIIIQADHEQALAVSLHENLFREDLNPVDEAKLFEYLRDQLRYSNKKTAQLVAKSEGYVSQRLELLTWLPQIIDALRRSQIGFAVARELSRVEDRQYALFLLKHAIDEGVNYRTAANWVRAWRASKSMDQEPPSEEELPFISSDYKPPLIACHLCGDHYSPVELTTLLVCKKCLREGTGQD
jgi:ParB family chromosome partitioning protein